ncbi:MFS transporter [Hydrogenophaga crocea]|uniref:MFS transporter n=1 Tax=Hydrogenophaga crocea TaxID=2716225 RepID=A0A6G8IF64_9BURK|nr:MFS transporter [Hydrogenophaga crocea]QIM51751.1 MFS transporter [Hydrogenophaga crocea]
MLSVLRHRTYRRLFGAQAIALVGTGLATVALSLLAFELAGQSAGLVLGTALAIKMVAYVGIAPVATAVAQRLPRRQLLVALDLVRAAVALSLPFVTQIWQIYALIFLLQAASASFTPTFQATIPDVLPDEQEYTKALSLSRMAYDLESLLSPMLAAALLGVMSFHALFAGTVLGFLASALLVASVTLPGPAAAERRGFYDRTTRGLRIYLATPRLRGLLAINFGLAAAGAMVFVNTVVLVQAQWGLPQNALALALASFGAGSMVAALGLPRLLERWPDRPVMLTGTAALCVLMVAGIWLTSYPPLLLLWFMVGVAYAIAQTPSGRLLRRSAHPTDRPALFAAQFALSHACWLLFYPLAGWAGAHWGLSATFGVLGAAVLLALCVAWRLWPAEDPEVIEHHHDDGTRHAHAYWIDDQHPHWPVSRSKP